MASSHVKSSLTSFLYWHAGSFHSYYIDHSIYLKSAASQVAKLLNQLSTKKIKLYPVKVKLGDIQRPKEES